MKKFLYIFVVVSSLHCAKNVVIQPPAVALKGTSYRMVCEQSGIVDEDMKVVGAMSWVTNCNGVVMRCTQVYGQRTECERLLIRP